jgi:hypothetical protein
MAAKKKSPLAGLAAANPKVERLTAEQHVRVDLARRVLALCEFLNEEGVAWSCKVRTHSYDRNPDFTWLDFGEREPSETFAVSLDGNVVRHTCEYSGHNGDSYGDKYEALQPELALDALRGLCGQLERRALDAEERRLKEAADRRRADAAMKNLNARLRNRGVL